MVGYMVVGERLEMRVEEGGNGEGVPQRTPMDAGRYVLKHMVADLLDGGLEGRGENLTPIPRQAWPRRRRYDGDLLSSPKCLKLEDGRHHLPSCAKLPLKNRGEHAEGLEHGQ